MPAVQETIERVRRIDVDQYKYGFVTDKPSTGTSTRSVAPACHQPFGPRSASMPAWTLVTSELADCAYRDPDFDARVTETGA